MIDKPTQQETDDQDISPGDVADFLGQLGKTETPVPAAREDDAEGLITPIQPGAADNPIKQEGPELGVEEDFSWFMRLPDLKDNVTVSDDDKDRYWRAFCHDDPVLFNIPIMRGSLVMRALSNHEYDVLARAGAQELQERPNMGALELSALMQIMALAMQLVRVHDKPYDHLSFTGKASDVEAQAVKLRDYRDTVLRHKDAAWTRMCIQGLRIFTAKLHICQTNAANGGFWSPAGIG